MERLRLLGHLFKEDTVKWILAQNLKEKKKSFGIKTNLVKIKWFLQHKFH